MRNADAKEMYVAEKFAVGLTARTATDCGSDRALLVEHDSQDDSLSQLHILDTNITVIGSFSHANSCPLTPRSNKWLVRQHFINWLIFCLG